MHFSTRNLSYQCLFFFFCLFPLSFSDPRISQSGLFCGANKAKTSTFVPTFVKEMESLSQLITTSHFATYDFNISTTLPPIYALAQCYHDLSQTDCLLCYAASRTKLPRCIPSISGSIFLDGCFLRYDNYSFYHEFVSPVLDTVKCSSEEATVSDYENGNEFVKKVGFAVGNVSRIAVSKGGFGAVELKGIYALAQCWESVGKDGCDECLRKAAKGVIRGCGMKTQGRAMNAGCYMRYSTQKFFNNGESGDDHGSSHLGIMIAIALAATAFLMLSLFVAFAGYIRLLKMKEERNNQGVFATSMKNSCLSFKYETLEKATDYFNPSKRLGQGGAGSVYMGTLPNGKTVAVKRLIFNTRQWVDEFFNEVNLISRIEHKNLVKLIGCSIEGPESLLVYEYVPNKSLDQFIFDKNKAKLLNWKQRFNIILGTAEGLLYLHDDTETTIIHRDIKSSNILLDENFTPKIADFGLARCFAADKTHLSTAVAGTLGYMAPEYLVRGQLTEKADVYSFGILVLETICGRRNNAFPQCSASPVQTVKTLVFLPLEIARIHSYFTRICQLQTTLVDLFSHQQCAIYSFSPQVWTLYRSNKLFEAVDPDLKDDFPAKDACNVLQIGLLCTQASAALRPSMAQVVTMLSEKNCEIPTPNQPPFLNASVLQPGISSRSYSTESFVSNVAIKINVSDASSESSSAHSSDGHSRRTELSQK